MGWSNTEIEMCVPACPIIPAPCENLMSPPLSHQNLCRHQKFAQKTDNPILSTSLHGFDVLLLKTCLHHNNFSLSNFCYFFSFEQLELILFRYKSVYFYQISCQKTLFKYLSFNTNSNIAL